MNITDTAALIEEAKSRPSLKGDRTVALLIDALEASRPRVVRTVEGLGALPDGTYILTAYTFDRDKEPLILRHGPDWGLTDKHDLYWWTTDGGDQISSLDRVDDIEHLVLPATVLWTPEGA